MGLLNLFRSDSKLQEMFNTEFLVVNKEDFKRLETKITGINEEAFTKASINLGDALKLMQHQNRGLQTIDIYSPSGILIGKLLQNITDDLTIKGDWEVGPDGDTDYETEKWFWIIKGYAIFKGVELVKGRKKYIIELFYKQT